MKLVTGNNNLHNNIEISIQILLDGFSLFEPYQDKHNSEKLIIHNCRDLTNVLNNVNPTRINTIHLTPNPILVPSEIIANSNNHINSAQNVVAFKEQIDNLNVLFNAPADIINTINMFDQYATHTHALALTIKNAPKNTLTISQQHNCTNFVLTSTIALLDAITVNDITEQDILYYIKKLSPNNNISIITDNPQTVRMVAKYYKLQKTIITPAPLTSLL